MTEVSTEEWRPVPGYEDLYSVSSLGRVASVPRSGTKGGLLSVEYRRDGYPCVRLSRHGKGTNFNVHVLVATAFLGPRPPGMDVRHLDGGGSRRRRTRPAAMASHARRGSQLDVEDDVNSQLDPKDARIVVGVFAFVLVVIVALVIDIAVTVH